MTCSIGEALCFAVGVGAMQNHQTAHAVPTSGSVFGLPLPCSLAGIEVEAFCLLVDKTWAVNPSQVERDVLHVWGLWPRCTVVMAGSGFFLCATHVGDCVLCTGLILHKQRFVAGRRSMME